jgi:hypothetical protein
MSSVDAPDVVLAEVAFSIVSDDDLVERLLNFVMTIVCF